MKVLITRDKLDDLAVAVAEKAGLTTPLTIAQMQTAVENLSPGGDPNGDNLGYGDANYPFMILGTGLIGTGRVI